MFISIISINFIFVSVFEHKIYNVFEEKYSKIKLHYNKFNNNFSLLNTF